MSIKKMQLQQNFLSEMKHKRRRSRPATPGGGDKSDVVAVAAHNQYHKDHGNHAQRKNAVPVLVLFPAIC